jgi:hypothetical protein
MEKYDWNGVFDWIDDDQFTEGPPVEAPEESQLEAQNPKLAKHIGLGALSLVLAYTAGAAGAAYITHKEDEYDTQAALARQKLIDSQRNPACPSLPERTVQSVAKLLRQPDEPSMVRTYDGHGNWPKQIMNTAKRYNLDISEGLLQRKEIIHMAKTPRQVLRYLNNYTGLYGFKVTINTTASKLRVEDISPVDTSKVKLNDFKSGATALMDAFFVLPVQEVKASGLKQIWLFDSFHEGGKRTDVAADAGGSTINMSLSTFYEGDRYVVWHELGHLIDNQYCGDFGFEHYDPQFTNLNPSGFEYGVTPFTNGSWKGITETEYGSSNMAEDKADLYARILGGLNSLSDHPSSTLRGKTDLLLARLGKKVPTLPAYIAAISIKHHKK